MTLLSSIVGGGSGSLTFPQAVTTLGNLTLKSVMSTSVADSASTFWDAIDVSHTAFGWESVSFTVATGTAEQTIIDVSGDGVLTQVISPSLSASGTVTIRVTIDGVETTYISPTISVSTEDRFLLGFYDGYKSTGLATTATGRGSSLDGGFSLTEAVLNLPSSIQTLMDSNIGQVFKTSLKVTVQGSVNFGTTGQRPESATCYSTYIPEGL